MGLYHFPPGRDFANQIVVDEISSRQVPFIDNAFCMPLRTAQRGLHGLRLVMNICHAATGRRPAASTVSQYHVTGKPPDRLITR